MNLFQSCIFIIPVLNILMPSFSCGVHFEGSVYLSLFSGLWIFIPVQKSWWQSLTQLLEIFILYCPRKNGCVVQKGMYEFWCSTNVELNVLMPVILSNFIFHFISWNILIKDNASHFHIVTTDYLTWMIQSWYDWKPQFFAWVRYWSPIASWYVDTPLTPAEDLSKLTQAVMLVNFIGKVPV